VSTENVEIVRQVFDAVARRDTAAVLALYDRDIEVDVSQSKLGEMLVQPTYHGYDGLQGLRQASRSSR
jgi:ketosteroid isomerase-like protein